jgi:hypothetical protein
MLGTLMELGTKNVTDEIDTLNNVRTWFQQIYTCILWTKLQISSAWLAKYC